MKDFVLHVELNAVMAHREIKNHETKSILFVSIHLMTTKRVPIIALAVLLLDKEETREDKYHKTVKRSC